MKQIELIYKRLPNRVSFFQQELIYEDETAIVTRQQVKPSSPLVIDGVTVLDDNYTALWFIFPGKWYDMGKMYNPQGKCTGYYCDIIIPMRRTISKDKQFLFTVEITDLCLDLWICSLRSPTPSAYGSLRSLNPPSCPPSGGKPHSAYSPDGSYHILDEDEFELAVQNGWMDNTLAQRARQELNNLIQSVRAGKFPPAIVETIEP
jgi:predicted RNA-binding protein associated with RNAse of E/G family